MDVEALQRQLQRKVRTSVRDAGGRMREQLVRATPHLVWVYGHDPRAPFPPHLRLDGRHLESWEDPLLAKPAGAFPAGRAWYYPGDHAGCLCDYRIEYDRSFKSASAWTVRYSDNDRVFTARFQNRRYDPDALRLPPARTKAAAVGRAPIPTRSRAQPSDRALRFYRPILSQASFSAEVQISLAVAR